MLIFKVFTLISAVHCSASPKRINLIWFHCWLISSRAHKWSLSFKQPVALLTGDEEENEAKFTESGGGAGGACRFSRFWCRLALQSSILHTLQYAVGVQAAAGLVPTERLVPPYDVKPTQCHFNFSSLITLGPYNLTARTQTKAVENNLGGTF